MSQPLDREASFPRLGKVNEEAGEFWAENPFRIPESGGNLSAYEPNRVYLNVRERGFLDASYASNADIDADSRSVVAGDFNGDEAPDLLVASAGGGPLRLFLNELPRSARRVRIELEGVVSNKAGIGSRVIVEAGGRRIVRDVFPANGFAGQAPAELIVGLGDASRIDRLTVRWPTGETQSFAAVAEAATITVREGADSVRVGR